MANETTKARVGTRAITLAVKPNTEFKELVRILEQTFVVPKIPGVGGCDPCLSGLDRFVIESSIIQP